MPFHAALSKAADVSQALAEIQASYEQTSLEQPDLSLIFFSPHFLNAAEKIASTIQEQLKPKAMLGCVGEGIIANAEEIEHQPALVVWSGRWISSMSISPCHLTWEQTSEGPGLLGWPDAMVSTDPSRSSMLVLGDPYTFPADVFLQTVNEQYQGLRILGGMASGSRGPGQTRLLLNGNVYDQGAIGALLEGPAVVRSVVSQGCRPVGRHLVITKAEENLILEMGGKTAFTQLQEVFQSLSPHEQELFKQGPHIGRVINEYQDRFERGDFLIRNIIGVEQQTGSMAITDRVRAGQTVQFHVRDAETADEDLRHLLQQNKEQYPRDPGGALIFSCNGRGTRMFAQPHHDARVLESEVGSLPAAGFFAAGELGPVGGTNFIHGFTASVVLFED